MRRRKTPVSAKLFRWAWGLLILATVASVILFCRNYLSPSKAKAETKPGSSAPGTVVPTLSSAEVTDELPTTPAPETTTEGETTVSTVTLLAVGDNLIHNTVYKSGWKSNPWNYDHLYRYVRDDIEAADLAVINQETIFVQDHKNVSNYPLFGTPREIGDAVYKAGFDVILHASNHVLDMGIENVFDAIDYWSDKDVTVLGIHKSAEDAAIPTIVEKNGIKIGMINYTYGFNGFGLPAGKEYAVDQLDNREKLLSDIAYLESHADITVAFLHMGQEYAIRPDQYAKDMVDLVVCHGVDLCIDAHPHVVQPCEEVTASNGNKALVYWSLGNFISAQDELDRLLGAMATVTIQKTVTGGKSVTEIIDHDMQPLVTHTAYDTTYAVYHLEDYNDWLGARNIFCRLTTEKLWARWHEIVGDEP